MNIFNLSSDYAKIKASLISEGVYAKKFTFVMFGDGAMIYRLKHDDFFYEISIICNLNDNTFLQKETFYELSKKYGIKYLKYDIYKSKLNNSILVNLICSKIWTSFEIPKLPGLGGKFLENG